MKIIILSILTLSTIFANYNYTSQEAGKIDMHGGKNSNLLMRNKNSLSNTSGTLFGIKNITDSNNSSTTINKKTKETTK